ncbi:MAG: ABC transporter ATP-binding protein [Gemmatimonadota bacterium]|nr:ABC transporter ATP-binding protein [Gemmatimonadota bacterium]
MPPAQDGFQEEEALGKGYDARLMRRLLQYLRPYWRYVALAITILVAASFLQVVGPWLTRIALDDAIPNGDTSLLATLAAAYLGSVVLGFGLLYAQTVLTTWLGQRVMYDLRTEIFGKLQRFDLRFYDKNPVGRLMTRITSDVETLNELFSSGVVAVFGDLFTLGFILSAMLIMDWRLALITFSVLPFVVLTAFLFRMKLRTAYRDIRVRLARINAYLHERITGMMVVKLFNREGHDARRHAAINQDYLEAHLRSITYYALFFPVIELFTAIALALIIWRGGATLLAGVLTVGVLAAFIQYAQRFFRPIQDLSEKYNLLQAAMASSERIFLLIDRESAIVDPPDPVSLEQPVRGEIEFQDVWFAYGKRAENGTKSEGTDSVEGDGSNGDWDWALKGVSFRAASGERLAIVGHTGAGKTTIISLLMRFYQPQRGRILLDGIPIDRLRLDELREHIGLVLQDVFLFSQDVAHNIRLGAKDIPEDRVREAAERIGAAPFIERLADGYNQELGERGATLSVGERQLVSFARALAFDPQVLVLDEATSSVDSEIEAQIEAATNKLMAGRTSMVIAHRLSTILGADHIVVLHQGELCEEGTHQELLEHGGLYARLHELQFARTPA